MLLSIILLVFIIMPSLSNLHSAELVEIVDKSMVHILNDSEIIAKNDSKLTAYKVQVIRLRDHGECDGTPESCPKETLYIAVSSFGEYPDQKLYALHKAYGWEFLKWINLPKMPAPGQYVEFEIVEKVLSTSQQEGWWMTRNHKVSVNTEQGLADIDGGPGFEYAK